MTITLPENLNSLHHEEVKSLVQKSTSMELLKSPIVYNQLVGVYYDDRHKAILQLVFPEYTARMTEDGHVSYYEVLYPDCLRG